ncbi:MAG: Hpt domain-containing protein [Leptospiraceae bacterium]|nr:Hpt domain-containing protein [Leptospiraceae bacterium]MCP5501047.1 Hpt domain-containing protein [Leptospiraceae bacterium]
MYVDWTRIKSFANEDDPEDLEWLKSMIQNLFENTLERLNELDSLMENRDLAKIQSLLHQLKGVAANFGLVILQNQCIRAETEAKEGNQEKSIEESKKIRGIWEDTRIELQNRYFPS